MDAVSYLYIEYDPNGFQDRPVMSTSVPLFGKPVITRICRCMGDLVCGVALRSP